MSPSHSRPAPTPAPACAVCQPAAAQSGGAPQPRSPAIAAASGRFYRHPATVPFRWLGLGRGAAPAGPEYIMRVVRSRSVGRGGCPE